MKKTNIGFLCIFMFITLLFSLNSISWAVEEGGGTSTVGTEILGSISSNSKLVIHQEKGTDDSVVDERYAFTIKDKAIPTENYENGFIVIDGNRYTFKISYTDANGNEVVLGRSTLAYNQTRKEYIQYLNIEGNDEIPADKKVKYTLEAVDGGENIELNDQVLKVDVNKPIVVEKFEETSGWDAFWGLVTGDSSKLARLITETISKITIPCGDAFLYMICSAIGEPVTIDKAVYNEVSKLDIDFFDGTSTSTGANELNTPIKNILKDLVNYWYKIFRNIALAFYMVLLVYIGLKILLTSTAERKANYKSIFSAWVMGIVMLMFFPYVMKYAIQINNVLCGSISEAQKGVGGTVDTNATVPNGNIAIKKLSKYFGTNGFVMIMIGDVAPDSDITDKQMKEFGKNAYGKFGNNVMMEIRFKAANTLNLPLTVVYFILIGQLLAILIVYYKRVFTIAFLITIFPLVVLLYPLNKIGDIKINTFGTWFKEFLVNVFVQSFHAVTYYVVVTIGVKSYTNSKNWLFMIMSVLFLFEGEKIIRGIFSAKSTSNSIADLAVAGAMAMKITKGASGLIPKLDGNSKSSSSDASEKAEKDRDKAKQKAAGSMQTPGAAANIAAATGEGGQGQSMGTTPVNNITLGRQVVTAQDMYSTINKNFDDKSKKNIVGRVGNVAAKAGNFGLKVASPLAGATVGMTVGMAQSDANAVVSNTLGGMETGENIGNAGQSLISGVANVTTGKVAKVAAGHALANEYMNGSHDDELGITEADAQLDKAKADALRTAAAKIARTKGRFGNTAAEIAFIKDRINRYNSED